MRHRLIAALTLPAGWLSPQQHGRAHGRGGLSAGARCACVGRVVHLAGGATPVPPLQNCSASLPGSAMAPIGSSLWCFIVDYHDLEETCSPTRAWRRRQYPTTSSRTVAPYFTPMMMIDQREPMLGSDRRRCCPRSNAPWSEPPSQAKLVKWTRARPSRERRGPGDCQFQGGGRPRPAGRSGGRRGSGHDQGAIGRERRQDAGRAPCRPRVQLPDPRDWTRGVVEEPGFLKSSTDWVAGHRRVAAPVQDCGQRQCLPGGFLPRTTFPALPAATLMRKGSNREVLCLRRGRLAAPSRTDERHRAAGDVGPPDISAPPASPPLLAPTADYHVDFRVSCHP